MKEENVSGPLELRASPEQKDDNSDDNDGRIIHICFYIPSGVVDLC